MVEEDYRRKRLKGGFREDYSREILKGGFRGFIGFIEFAGYYLPKIMYLLTNISLLKTNRSPLIILIHIKKNYLHSIKKTNHEIIPYRFS